MKVMPYETSRTVRISDEFGYYEVELDVKLIWDHGFYWVISTGDFCCREKKLSECVMSAIEILLKGDVTPCYYRLKEQLYKMEKKSKEHSVPAEDYKKIKKYKKLIGAGTINEAVMNAINFALIDAEKGSERCVCCGQAIPEGRQVCPACEKEME